MRSTRTIIVAALAGTSLAACSGYQSDVASASEPAATGTQMTQGMDTQTEQVASDINALFADYDAAQLAMSPLSKSYRGIRDEDYDQWGDFSDAGEVASEALTQKTAQMMRDTYDLASLSPNDALSYRLFDAMAKRSASLHKFRKYDTAFDQMRGAQSQLPAFLINIHSVSNEAQATDYLERISGLADVLDTLVAESKAQADGGVMPPDWVYPYVISDVENLLEAGDDNAILSDFRGKVSELDIDDSRKATLMAGSVAVWNAQTRPAYQRLLAEMKRQQAMAPTDDGIWRYPEGAEYYQALLNSYTTTELSPDEIHNIGLREVERIHGQMRAIMEQVEFDGSLQDFFQYTRTDDRFYYDNREDYLRDARAVIDRLEKKLPEYFGVLPTSPFVIKPVEAFREQSAGKAFYQRPAPDGSRPGTYYVNLYNLKDMSKNELEALAYHEALPGHHLQLAIQTDLGDLPAFRRFGGVTAYSEGWGLYSEELGKDMGFYTDPYSDFGRLGMELWRAARLVVDTGLHHKRWSRETAMQYLTDNTPNPDGDVRKAIERYVVYPGQATAYMIGKLKIMELRERAKTSLGGQYDIREFHDVILTSGPVPLSIMEENVDSYIRKKLMMAGG